MDKINGELYELYQYCSCDKVEKNEMGAVCSMYGGEESRIQCFWRGNLWERYHLGDSGLYGRVILRCIFRKWVVGIWTGSSWLRMGTWRALVSAVMNIHVP
jgi:hypothetical protein